MYHILIYPQSGFQNYQELFQEIFEKHGIENPFCDISNCCNISPCNKGKFYQSFTTFDSFSLISKFKRNQKYLVLYQKNIVLTLEKEYMQDQSIEKSGSTFLSWIQQNKTQYSQFSSQYLQSSSKSVMYMDYQHFETTPLQSILSIMKFLEPNFPFDQNIVFTCFKVFDQLNGKPNYGKLYSDYLLLSSQKEESETQEPETEIQNLEMNSNETETQNQESETQKLETEIQNQESETQKLETEIQNLEMNSNETETQNQESETHKLETEIQNLEMKSNETESNITMIQNEVKPIPSNPVDGFNAEMESLYLELLSEKKTQQTKMQSQPKTPPKKQTSPHKKPAKQNPQAKAKAMANQQKRLMIQRQLQKATAQNKQFQYRIGNLNKFIK
jgi:hypothetical protein